MANPTVSVAVKVDHQQFQKDMAKIGVIAREGGKAASDALDAALSPARRMRDMTAALNPALSALARETRALEDARRASVAASARGAGKAETKTARPLEEGAESHELALRRENALLNERTQRALTANAALKNVSKNVSDVAAEPAQASGEWTAAAQKGLLDYQNAASKTTEQVEKAFTGLFNDIDSVWRKTWLQMLQTGKVSLDSFKALFTAFLEDLIHTTVARPIIVQIAGVTSWMLGSDGAANAASLAGASGGSNGGGAAILTDLFPTKGLSGLSTSLNDAMAEWFPKFFSGASAASALSGQAAVSEALAEFAAGTKAATDTAFNALADRIVAENAAKNTFTQQAGSLIKPFAQAAAAYAITGIADQVLGLSKTYTNVGKYAQIGAAVGSFLPFPGGSVVGAGTGALIGRLTGKRKPKRPAVWSQLAMNLGGTGMSESQWTKDISDSYVVNASGRNKASDELIAAFTTPLSQVGQAITEQVKGLASALPDDYAAQFRAQLAARPIKLEWDVKDKDINDDTFRDMAAQAQEKAAEVMLESFRAMDFSGYGGRIDVDQSSLEGLTKFTRALAVIDETLAATKELEEPTSQWVTQAKAAVAQMNAWETSMKSTGVTTDHAASLMRDYRGAYIDSFLKPLDDLLAPLSALEQRTQTTMESLRGYEEALKLLGGTTDDLAKVDQARVKVREDLLAQARSFVTRTPQVVAETLETVKSLNALYGAMVEAGNAAEDFAVIDQARAQVLEGLMDKARAHVESTPEIVSQVEALNGEFEALREAMILAGNAAEDLTALQGMQAEAVAQLQARYAESFRQTYEQRYAALNGDDDAVAKLQQDASHRSELEAIGNTWGKDSDQYKQMVALQEAEAAKLRLEQARAEYDRLQARLEQQRSQLARLEQEAVRLQINEIQKLQTASKDRVNALEKELSAAQKLRDTWEDVFATVYAKRVDLHQGGANPDVFGRLDTAQSEFDKLYAQAKAGDADAAKEMAGVAGELLNLRGETTANRDAYLDAFYEVDKKLKEVGALADSQVSDAQAQLTALQAQLDAENAQYSILVSQLEAQQGALSALSGQNQTLAGIQSQIANLKTQINITVQGQQTSSTVVDQAQQDYDHAKDQVEPTTPKMGVYGSKYATEYELLQAKVASLNRGENIDPTFGILAGGWNVSNTVQAMNKQTGSVAEWYRLYGKDEGFARGGLALPGGGKFFGERGIEYGDVSRPTRVYDAKKTLLMQENAYDYARDAHEGMRHLSSILARVSGGDGGRGSDAADSLGREIRDLRTLLRTLLTSIAKNTSDVRDFLEEFDENGIAERVLA